VTDHLAGPLPAAPGSPAGDGESPRERIRGFLARYVRRQLADDEDIFAAGFVNSLLAMQLVTFVERAFGVAVGDEDLDLDNFRSVEAIATLVERKRSGSAGG
jgi:acyl carrier protein